VLQEQRVITQKPQIGLGRVQIAVTRSIPAIVRIQVATAKSLPGYSRVLVLQNKVQVGSTRLEVTRQQSISGVAKLSFSHFGYQTGTTRIVAALHSYIIWAVSSQPSG